MPSLVSLITPTLNAGRYISETLASVNGQDYPALEQIIVDGGSTDDTLERVGREGRRVADVLPGPDSGTSEAINKGFARARGEFVWILNADDGLAGSTAISRLVGHLLRHEEADFVFGHMRLVNGQGRPIGQRTFRAGYGILDLLSDRRHLPFAGCLLRRRMLDTLGGFNPAFRFANDLDFLLRLTRVGTMQGIGEATGVFRLHGEASTSRNIALTGAETVRICRDHLERPDLPREVSARRPYLEAAVNFYAASVAFHVGTPREVREALRQAAQADPLVCKRMNYWLYSLSALLGSRAMACVSGWSRRLIHSPWFQELNSRLSWEICPPTFRDRNHHLP